MGVVAALQVPPDDAVGAVVVVVVVVEVEVEVLAEPVVEEPQAAVGCPWTVVTSTVTCGEVPTG